MLQIFIVKSILLHPNSVVQKASEGQELLMYQIVPSLNYQHYQQNQPQTFKNNDTITYIYYIAKAYLDLLDLQTQKHILYICPYLHILHKYQSRKLLLNSFLLQKGQVRLFASSNPQKVFLQSNPQKGCLQNQHDSYQGDRKQIKHLQQFRLSIIIIFQNYQNNYKKKGYPLIIESTRKDPAHHKLLRYYHFSFCMC
ncbi:unnamed protein product [Paramecium sonneborni]|uniref:Uncharacterized protein n=1 Tax=Paramecium sonneborni TaxID=65129 RepID=A0A8S1QKQ1_9CILI|nr:unnamed protein product [Paramecium sonneborni]